MRKFKRLTMTLALLIMAVGGAWAETGENIFQYCYDCQRSPAYPKTTASASLSGFANPLVGYKGSGFDSDNTSAGPWKLEYMGIWSTTDQHEVDDVSYYQYTYNCTDVPVFRLYQWNATANEYQHAAYGVVCAYAKVSNAVEHSAMFVSKDGWGCVLTNSSHSSSMNITFDEDLTTGLTTLIAAATPEPTEWSLTPDADKKVWTLDKMPASDVELQVEYEPTKVTMAANDNAMGTVEVAGESKVEWTADTWKGWTYNTKEYTVDDITMTSSDGSVYEYTYDYSGGKYKNSLNFFVDQWEDNSTVTFSTTGAPFSRIEFTMIDNYSEYTPNIKPNDNWTFEGKSAVWEGKATKSLTLQSCSTYVSKITFYKGAIPDGVTINTDGTFTVAKTATVTLKATPAEGYKFLYWEDDQTNTNPVREVTIESGMADMTYKAVFAEILYNVTFVEGTNPDPENPEWTATPNPAKTKQTVTVTYTGSKKVIDVTVKKKDAAPALAPTTTVTWNSSDFYFDENPYTKDGVTLTPSNDMAASGNNLYEFGDNTFTTTLGKFIKIEIAFESTTHNFDGWTKGTAEQYQPDPNNYPDWWENLVKLTWTGDAESVTIKGKDVFGIHSITFTIQ